MANADTICKSGVSYPLAIEIARQMTAGAGNGNVDRLMTSGMPNQQAVELARQINANSFDANKLALSTINPSIAKLLKDHSGH